MSDMAISSVLPGGTAGIRPPNRILRKRYTTPRSNSKPS